MTSRSQSQSYAEKARAGDWPEESGSAEPLLSERNTDGTLGSTVDLPIEQIAADEIAAGMFVGRYRLVKRLGRGGTGEVWQGRDPHLSRFVAVKLIRSDLYVSAELKEAFLREGRRLAQLAHPSIVEIFDVGVANDRPFLVTQFAEGGTLADRIERGRPSPTESAAWLAQVARAAHFAHLQGVVHRDVKPSNILLDGKGQALLGDFGLAISEEEQVHARPSTLGTYAFMSPEQLRGASHAVDGRADIYALGVTLYLCLTGRLPFLADTPARYRQLVLDRDPRPLRAVDDSIAPALERICLKCLARDPGDRYTTALDLAQDLDGWLARGTRGVGSLRRVAIAALISLAAMSALGGGVALWRWSDGGSVGLGPAIAAASQDDSAPPKFDGPMELVSPSEAGIASFRMDEQGEVSFSSDRTALLRLGEHPAEARRISVDVVRSAKSGWGGVFWGRYLEDEDGIPKFRFLSCGIMNGENSRPQLYLCEHVSYLRDPYHPDVVSLFRVKRIEGALSATTKIDIRDMDGAARIVLTNGNTVLTTKLDDERNPALVVRPVGDFGLYCQRTHLVFKKLVCE